MENLDMLCCCLGGELAKKVALLSRLITDIRLRAGQASRLRLISGAEEEGEFISLERLREIIYCMMENSLYACERELRQGYFTMRGGFRVGVCGKIVAGSGGIDNLGSIASACIRIPRQAKGCAAELFEKTAAASVLFLSPPGMGKTTLLRDYIRLVSNSGLNVGVADERRELGACIDGMAQLDLGPRTDVMDGCPKALAISMMLRACAPDMIAADEIGGAQDAGALRDAMYCGVKAAATVHAGNFRDLMQRSCLREIISEGLFDWFVLLGPQPGRIKYVRSSAELRSEYG